MWRRTFIRFMLVVLVVAAGLLVFAASHTRPITPKNCTEAQDNCSNTNKSQADFNIWESISRTLTSSVQY